MTCQNLSGDLTIIRSEDENNFIQDLVRNQQTGKSWGAWLGLKRKADKAFYWIDDTPLAGQYAAWASGEPDHLYEHCVHSALRSKGRWNDNRCNLPKIARSKAPVVLCQKKYI